MTYLLDTSAILTHLLGEPGCDQVTGMLAGGPEQAAMAAPSWVELERRLTELIPDSREADRIWHHYTHSLCALLPVDEAASLAAIRIRRAARPRLPLVDALIAGCAAASGLILVHRDEHMNGIPGTLVQAVCLPNKA